jgi:lipoate-protein ligase A
MASIRTPCSLIVDGADLGAAQMAVDEALLDSVAAEPYPALRFYRWSQPTLSLGYFQSYSERAAHAPSLHCPLVRRQTGGGAILHDHELTYSLVVPCADPLAQEPARLYGAVHDALIEVLVALGCQATLQRDAVADQEHQQPFLCFLRRAPGDVLLGPIKICGSAQRRRRGAILQHGSLLLARSTAAPELPGILERSGRRMDPGELATGWGRGIAERLRFLLVPREISLAQRQAAQKLSAEKYSHARWNQRR